MIFFLSSSSGYTNLRWRNNKPEKINIRILATDSNGNSWRSAFNIILKSHVVGVCLRHLISPSFAVDAVNSSARSALYLSALCWGEFIISATFLANCGHVRGTLQQTQSHFMCFCCCIFVLLLCLFVFFFNIISVYLCVTVWRCEYFTGQRSTVSCSGYIPLSHILDISWATAAICGGTCATVPHNFATYCGSRSCSTCQ